MFDFIKETFERLIAQVELVSKRYLYNTFRISRLTGLVGPRGVGKTTLMLQYIKENLYSGGKVFYFSADSLYFRQTTLLEFINELYRMEGYRFYFIDEIHQYKNWNQELKNLYDSFPDINIVYSGSSMLDLIQGTYDLSRRAKMFRLNGMSFREYLNFVAHCDISSYSFDEMLVNPTHFSHLGQLEKAMGHFKTYLGMGYYPFVFEDPYTYHERVMRIIEKIIYEDIPNYYDLKTPNLHIFKRILSYLASIPPGEINTNNIAQNMGIAHQTVNHYLQILENVGLVQMIYPFEGGSQYLRKPQKILLHNTTLLHTLQEVIGQEISKGTLRELFFIQALRDSGQTVFYSKQGDYRTKNYVFEIGGKNKTGKQIKGMRDHGFLVKDDILTPSSRVLPLFYFGFLY